MKNGRKRLDTIAAEIIGKNIRRHRVGEQMTQTCLAEASYMSQKMVSLFELGQAMPNAVQIINIAKALRKPVESFVKE